MVEIFKKKYLFVAKQFINSEITSENFDHSVNIKILYFCELVLKVMKELFHFFIFVFIYWCCLPNAAYSQKTADHKTILIVDYRVNQEENNEILINGLKFNLGKSIPNLTIKEFSINDSASLELYPSSDKGKDFRTIARNSDLIITVDETALRMVSREREKYFPQMPIIYLGISSFYDLSPEEKKFSTGVIHNINFKRILDKIVTVHKSVKSVEIILDDRINSYSISSIQNAIKSYSSALTINVYNKLSTNEIGKLAKDKDDKVIILLGHLLGDDNIYLSEENSTLILEKRLDVPIYTTALSTINSGAIGCFVPNNFSQVADASKMAAQILNGISISRIPVKQNNNVRSIYDYYMLTRHDIDYEFLPAGTVVMNKPETFYDEYGEYVWIVTIAFLILSLTIVFLVLNIKKRMLIQRQLTLSEKKFRGFFEQSTDGITLMNEQGLIIEWNKGLENITGLSKEYVVNKEQWEIQFELLPDFLKKEPIIENYKKELIDFLKTGQGEWINTLNDILIQNKEKGVIYAQQLLFPIKTEKGFMAGSIIRDVTNQKLAEQELISAKDEAERSDRIKSEFLAQMSHEIRTPINAILSFASLINDQLTDNGDPEIQEYFNTIDSGARRLIRTIDLILNMAEVKAGNYAITTKTVDLEKDILTKIVKDFYSTAIQKNIKLNFVRKTENCFIQGDSYTIIQIFNALIDNAFKYTEMGSVEIILFRDENEQVCVEVKDTGIGISQEYLPKLFSAFSQEQTGYSRKYDGTGLGLALAKNYAGLNNADILVKSEKGVGSSFIVIFKK